MRYRMIVVTALLGVLASVVSASGWNLSDTYSRRLSQFQRDGFREVSNAARGDLNDSQSTRWTVTLRAGSEYRLFGACDEDCQDLDLEIYDANGRLVDEDTASDDFPVVSVRPRYTQEYSFRVTMADCSYEPCAYMVGVLGRDIF
jgi:hypothetical protein